MSNHRIEVHVTQSDAAIVRKVLLLQSFARHADDPVVASCPDFGVSAVCLASSVKGGDYPSPANGGASLRLTLSNELGNRSRQKMLSSARRSSSTPSTLVSR
jgi:hypothetical protein